MSVDGYFNVMNNESFCVHLHVSVKPIHLNNEQKNGRKCKEKTQPEFTCSNSTTETPEQCVKSVQS